VVCGPGCDGDGDGDGDGEGDGAAVEVDSPCNGTHGLGKRENCEIISMGQILGQKCAKKKVQNGPKKV